MRSSKGSKIGQVAACPICLLFFLHEPPFKNDEQCRGEQAQPYQNTYCFFQQQAISSPGVTGQGRSCPFCLPGHVWKDFGREGILHASARFSPVPTGQALHKLRQEVVRAQQKPCPHRRNPSLQGGKINTSICRGKIPGGKSPLFLYIKISLPMSGMFLPKAAV